nr:unnamed protein product [Callosobruchus analis]
MPQRGKEDL